MSEVEERGIHELTQTVNGRTRRTYSLIPGKLDASRGPVVRLNPNQFGTAEEVQSFLEEHAPGDEGLHAMCVGYWIQWNAAVQQQRGDSDVV